MTLADGVTWGVEVTRGYHRVPVIGANGRFASSDEVLFALQRLGDEIGEETRHLRTRQYSFFLRGHGLSEPLTGRRENLTYKKWAADVRRSIVAHIEADLTTVLNGRMFTLMPGDKGPRWSVFPQAGVHDVKLALRNAVRSPLESKAKDLSRWTERFAERRLLILNFYPLADIEDATREIRDRLAEDRGHKFDGAFWLPWSGRDLLDISK